nr:PREDICTED: uncharacterized protein LOC104144958 [Struthio camelus australis]
MHKSQQVNHWAPCDATRRVAGKQAKRSPWEKPLLMQEPSGSAVLTGEQRSVLSALAGRCLGGALAPGRRSSVVDESCHSLLSHSDISYDRTEDDVVVDVTVVKTLKRKAQERQRASLAPQIGPVVVAKRHRPSVAPPNAAAAADIPDEAACGTALCRLVSELPPANRDTLAFLMLHLLRVSRSPECRMDVLNLSRVFGPTLVGHSSANPTPLTIMEDTPRQCKVVAQLLSLPPDFWRRFVGMEQENPAPLPASTPAPDGTPGSEREQLFCPITSPESNSGQLSPAGTCCLPSTLRSCVGTAAQPPQGPAPRNVGWFFPSLV